MSKRNEYEQLEFQRKHPHLFTTLTQLVNMDGSLTTYDQVTRSLKKTADGLSEGHIERFGGEHPTYCMRPIWGQPETPICQAIEHVKNEMDRCLIPFVANYKRVIADQNITKEDIK